MAENNGPLGSAEAYFDRGNERFERGDLDGAIADFGEVIRLRPDYVNAWLNRGAAWNIKGEHDKAITDLNEAIRLKPDYVEAWNSRGGAWGRKGEYDKAIADYDEAIRLQPGYAEAWNGRGIAWSKKGNYNKAISDYDEAIRLKSDYAEAWNNRGNAWSRKGDYDRAIADHEEALRLDPDSKEAIHNRAVALALKASEAKREELAMTITNTEKLREYYEKNMSISEGCEKQAKYILWGFGIILLSYLGWIACNTIMTYETTDKWNPFQIIPWLSLAAVGSVPFLLWYRLVQQRRFESLALSYAFLRKLIVEERISLYSADDPELRKQLLKLYTLHWMDKSPLEALLAIGGKKNSAGDSASSIAELLREMEKTLSAKGGTGKDRSG